MNPEIADLVHQILSQGLHLRERLRGLAQPDLAFLGEQCARMHGLFVRAHEATRHPDFSGEPEPALGGGIRDAGLRYPATRFLGVRYALACWADESLIDAQPWVQDWWKDQRLETELYGINERDWKFWEQARLSESKGVDALAGYFLCIKLGFRGNLRDNPAEVAAHQARVQPRLTSAMRQEWKHRPPDRKLRVHQQPLTGRDVRRRFVQFALLAVLVGLMIGSVLLIKSIS